MEAPAQIPCSGRCLVHLHSEAGGAWLLRRSCPLEQRLGPDGISYFLIKLGNNEQTFVSANGIRTCYLQSAIAECERVHGGRVQNIIAILPASMNAHQFQSELSAAAASAGVRIVDFVERSVLAAYTCEPLTSGRRTILVFDHGCGILEISLFTQDGSSLNKMDAVFDLGCPLLNYMISVLPGTLGAIDFNRDAYFLHEIRTKCELAKDALCLGSGPVEIEIQRLGMALRTLIDRELLVQLNLKHLRSGIMRCLTDAGVRQEAVDQIVLVGASSTIPEVLSFLQEFFPRRSIVPEIHPAHLLQSMIMQYVNIVSATITGPVNPLWFYYSVLYSL